MTAKGACGSPARRLCCHCHREPANRPRGLCWRCYHTPGVREQYPSTSKYTRRGVGNLTGDRPPPVPTDTLPGTPERVAVLAERAMRGEHLFHPGDTTRED